MNCNTSISTPSTPEYRDTSTNILSGVYTNTIQIQRKNCVRAIRVSEFQWKLFLKKARELGFSANELINQFIGSIVGAEIPPSPKPQLTFNIAIAKAESKPFINVGEYIAMLELNDLLSKIRQLKARAERERQSSDVPLTFTVERAKVLEQELRKVLKSAKSLPPEKFREVEAALTILRSIREGPK